MTDSTDNNQPEDNKPEASSSDNINNASNDLSNAAEEAMRLLKDTKNKPPKHKIAETTATEAVAEENGTTTNDLQQEAIKAMKLQAERQREAEDKARSAVESQSTFTSDMRLKLESSESDAALFKEIKGEMIVGRADNVTDYIPDIDLTPHGAYRLGLSRRHAIILIEEDRLLVKDLNSRNGTFVNGAIVPGGGKLIIRDGDEVRFGNLAMQASFVE